ncbi:hypothetical protein NSU_3019 [Novosphingobium pentaromativorans US6-1]|uniref:Uncharacterized protein n=1 Tax=Novosphingobium pentaromativorans US6-1 TaxID=1088721 RepID=G6EF98_9SPHN|nr:hypothetical protein NSU_3019 [Novosphingobium pentaromativorans US6-1]
MPVAIRYAYSAALATHRLRTQIMLLAIILALATILSPQIGSCLSQGGVAAWF